MGEIEIASRHFSQRRAWLVAERFNFALEQEGRSDYHYRVRAAAGGPFRWYVVLQEGERPASSDLGRPWPTAPGAKASE